ncbi:MAG: hypothetical protein AUH85_12720 [Chloroflexi bacterium 13_1_40CM_4_68_4]|nr:MAG: hypothetical protein AUH85_12720 [Chloroflexi bacterium 13_1_40CM_4_68_4]
MSGGDRLLDLVNAYRLSRATAVAIELRLPELVADGPSRVEDLARVTAMHAPSLRRLLRALASYGVFAEQADGRFGKTDLSELLRRDNEASVGHTIAMLDDAYHSWEQLKASVETGTPVYERIYGVSRWDYLATHPEESEKFNRAMVAASTRDAPTIVAGCELQGASVICDVGGGNGALLIAALKKHPRAAGIVFDLPQGVRGAEARFGAAGVADRCRVVAGDFFVDSPPAADAYLMKFILHDWPDDDCVRILSKVREAMRPQSRLLVIERALPERVTETASAQGVTITDLHMMVMLGGRERSEREYAQLLVRAGLRHTTTRDAGAFSILESQYTPA